MYKEELTNLETEEKLESQKEVEDMKEENKKDQEVEETEALAEADEDEFPELDLELINSIEHPTRSAIGGTSEASDIRIIFTKKNGKRMVLKENVIELLELEDTIQAGLLGDTLVLAKDSIASKINYSLKEQGKTFNVYNSKLIEDIVKALELDFSEVTSINLDVKYTRKNGITYLMAKNTNNN